MIPAAVTGADLLITGLVLAAIALLCAMPKSERRERRRRMGLPPEPGSLEELRQEQAAARMRALNRSARRIFEEPFGNGSPPNPYRGRAHVNGAGQDLPAGAETSGLDARHGRK